MNKSKRIFVIYLCSIFLLLIILVSITFCGSEEPFQYTFRQDRNNIESVEICSFGQYPGSKMEPLVSLTEDEIDAVLSYLSSLECWKTSHHPPPYGYGDIIICIKYLDGEMEIIGIPNNGWVTPSGDWYYSRNFFLYPDLKEIYFKYLDAPTLKKHEIYP